MKLREINEDSSAMRTGTGAGSGDCMSQDVFNELNDRGVTYVVGDRQLQVYQSVALVVVLVAVLVATVVVVVAAPVVALEAALVLAVEAQKNL